MRASTITIAELAAVDILEQAEWYEAQGDQRLARRWAAAVSKTVLRISEYPDSGALCRFNPPELAGTRRIPIDGFPRHLLFYQVTDRELLVLRVIHGARDLETLFG